MKPIVQLAQRHWPASSPGTRAAWGILSGCVIFNGALLQVRTNSSEHGRSIASGGAMAAFIALLQLFFEQVEGVVFKTFWALIDLDAVALELAPACWEVHSDATGKGVREARGLSADLLRRKLTIRLAPSFAREPHGLANVYRPTAVSRER